MICRPPFEIVLKVELLITLFGIFAKLFSCQSRTCSCKADDGWVVSNNDRFDAVLYLSASIEAQPRARTDEDSVAMLAYVQVRPLSWLSLALTGVPPIAHLSLRQCHETRLDVYARGRLQEFLPDRLFYKPRRQLNFGANHTTGGLERQGKN